MKQGIRVYNIYPKLLGTMDKWIEHFDRIKDMNFDWIYVNPIHSTSLSTYAIKDYYGYNPIFLKEDISGEDYEKENIDKMKETGNILLKKTCEEAEKRGMSFMIDLVINHTASDSELIKEHLEWYERKADGSIKHPGADDNGTWVEWGDLSQIDNKHSFKKDDLWDYWLDMIMFYASLGVKGFRCDAAYHVPNELWTFIIKKVKTKYPDVIFVAETLGCQPVELMSVANTGFDYVMNSFKWWDLKADWFLKDYREWAGKYPSMTFPENHDTERFAKEKNKDKNLAIYQYAISAFFCSSVATTIGYEFGFENKIDVVQTHPGSWEEKNYDISEEISKINKLKSEYTILQEDNMIELYHFYNNGVFAFTKYSLDGTEKVFVIGNGNSHNTEQIFVENIKAVMDNEEIKDISYGHKIDLVEGNLDYFLNPGEVKVFYIKK